MMDSNGQYECYNCMDGYIGRFCEIMINTTVPCNMTMCKDNGTDICTMIPEGEEMCHCKPMFAGDVFL